MMRKVLFLMILLLLIGLGAASVKAQVRIGGNTPPDDAAVLDLNADNTTNTGTKTLALPRVSLTSTTDLMGNASLLTGMLVYNTTATPGVGIYYWDGSKWVNVGSFVEIDGVLGNEVLNATTNGGLVRAGSGTSASPYTLGIATGGVTAAMLASGAANDADYIVGNEVTNATSGGGLVRAGSGTATSPYTLGISSGGVTTAMIANNAVTNSIIASGAVSAAKTTLITGQVSCNVPQTAGSSVAISAPGCDTPYTWWSVQNDPGIAIRWLSNGWHAIRSVVNSYSQPNNANYFCFP